MQFRIGNHTHTITKTDIAKHAVGFVVGVGAGYIVKAIIENNIEPEGIVDKTTTNMATTVFAWMAKEATRTYTDDLIDRLIAAWKRGQDLAREDIADERPNVAYIDL